MVLKVMQDLYHQQYQSPQPKNCQRESLVYGTLVFGDGTTVRDLGLLGVSSLLVEQRDLRCLMQKWTFDPEHSYYSEPAVYKYQDRPAATDEQLDNRCPEQPMFDDSGNGPSARSSDSCHCRHKASSGRI